MTNEPPSNAEAALTAADVIRLLDLKPHPEGGHFREIFRDVALVFPPAPAEEGAAARAASTAIYFLLGRGERSHWHRVDTVEIWHWYAGAPLKLEIARGRTSGNRDPGQRARRRRAPAGGVPAHAWQAAQSLGDWTLVGCTVAPAFDFAKFELAPKGWEPAAS